MKKKKTLWIVIAIVVAIAGIIFGVVLLGDFHSKESGNHTGLNVTDSPDKDLNQDQQKDGNTDDTPNRHDVKSNKGDADSEQGTKPAKTEKTVKTEKPVKTAKAAKTEKNMETGKAVKTEKPVETNQPDPSKKDEQEKKTAQATGTEKPQKENKKQEEGIELPFVPVE